MAKEGRLRLKEGRRKREGWRGEKRMKKGNREGKLEGRREGEETKRNNASSTV